MLYYLIVAQLTLVSTCIYSIKKTNENSDHPQGITTEKPDNFQCLPSEVIKIIASNLNDLGVSSLAQTSKIMLETLQETLEKRRQIKKQVQIQLFRDNIAPPVVRYGIKTSYIALNNKKLTYIFSETFNALNDFLKEYDITLTEILLNFNKLKKLPSTIEKITSLNLLYLNNNQFKELPSSILNLENLTKLDLYSNQLTELPSEIEKLKNLKDLDLRNNRFTKEPPVIKELTFKGVKVNLEDNSMGQ